MRLKRETHVSPHASRDTPLIGPPRWLPDPQLIELRREERPALRELHDFLMRCMTTEFAAKLGEWSWAE